MSAPNHPVREFIMKYKARVNDKVFEVEIELIKEEKGFSGGSFSSAGAAPSAAASAVKPARPTPASVPTPVKAAEGPASGSTSAKDIKSPMDGSVLSIKVAKGDSVSDGQTVCIIEAMKMEIEIKAESAGTVSELLVSPGDQVKNGMTMIRLS